MFRVWHGRPPLAGSLATKIVLPVILGHEMVGRIVSFGSGPRRNSVGQPLRFGDRITWAHTSCGSCFFCTVAQEPTRCENSPSRIRFRDDGPNELASLASCALRSVMNAFDAVGAIGIFEAIAVPSAGPLGLLATAVAKVAGAPVPAAANL